MYQNLTPYIDKNLYNTKRCFEKIINFNSHGFRGNELDPTKKNILIAGCSIYYCTGVDDPYIFPNLLIEKLGSDYGYLNVSMPGTGIEAQVKNITWAVSNFKFEKLLWLGSHPSRGICYNDKYGMMHYNPSNPPGINNPWFNSNQGKIWVDNRIGNDYDVMCKLTDLTETLFVLLKALNIDVYTRNWGTEYNDNFFKPIREKFNFNSLPFFYQYDKSIDGVHPGIKSHSVHAEELAKLIN
jgi:hypothetical protein